MKTAKALLFLSAPFILAFLLNTKFGSLPPILKFLDPFYGFWQNAEKIDANFHENLIITDAISPIKIAYDENMIPHIFAENDHDLYLAQGYVTAKHRLWQMDFQTRFAAGRISEIIGSKGIEVDQYQRRMGMVFGAENSLKGMLKDPKIAEIVNAYTKGINAYIHSLHPKDYPIEYKILDYKPEDWTPIKCALLLKQMSAILAMGSDEFYMTNILNKYGIDVINDLFPNYPYREDPIIPVGTKWDFEPLKIPSAPASSYSMSTNNIETKQKIEGIGSNNWAISGNKTMSGKPILANDPHLNMTLPSIWYQIQLHAPGINCYGVSLPGAPGIVIGFNNQIAWGVTNVAADVLDFYQIKFKDETKKEYWYNEKWNKSKLVLETIKVKGGKDKIDSVYYTHHGPVVYTSQSSYGGAKNIPAGSALKWIAHEESNELMAFYYLNRAKNYDDYRIALTYYSAPAQNFAFASVDNDIAITPNGKFPLKWKNQGKFILDGSDPASDWKDWVPHAHNPTVKNPSRGFISSANQSLTDQSYPYYLNWEYAPYERAKHINDRLTNMENATLDSMRLMQVDNYSVLAKNVVPTVISLIDTKNNKLYKNAFSILQNWDYRYDSEKIAPSIFELLFKRLADNIWSDDFKINDLPMRYPSRDRTVELIVNEHTSKWIDNKNTTQVETLPELVNEAFLYSVDSLVRRLGKISDQWNWGKVRNTHIQHLARIPGFGTGLLQMGGGASTINAMSESHGPSWRMVVELGNVTKGYGIYPGGQSGNPGSKYYDNMIQKWSQGSLDSLYLMSGFEDRTSKIIATIQIN